MDGFATQDLIREVARRLGDLQVRKDTLENDLEHKSTVTKRLSTVKVSSFESENNTVKFEEEEDKVKDLFSNEWLDSCEEVLSRCKEEFGFDLAEFVKPRLEEDPLAMGRTVNFIRSRMRDDVMPEQIILEVKGNGYGWQEDTKFLQPHQDDMNDPLLWWGDAFSEDGDEDIPQINKEDEVEDQEMEGEEEEEEENTSKKPSPSTATAASSSSTTEKKKENDGGGEDYYFGSYSSVDIHEDMLRDAVRTESYLNAITANEHMSNARVMDVGSGSGVLSMMCKRDGKCREVIAVEASLMMRTLSKAIFELNGFKVGKDIIQFNGMVEDFQLDTEDQKVDVIVSEWMGYALLYESMLDSVLVARDRFLKPGGRLFPNKANIFVEAIEDVEGRLSFWNDVYGFNYAPARGMRSGEVDVLQLTPEASCSNRIVLQAFDLETMKNEQVDFTAPFQLTCKPGCEVQGICLSFDTTFPSNKRNDGDSIVLSTTPSDTPTHWKQAVLWLEQTIKAKEEELIIDGEISFQRRLKGNKRELDICLKMTSPFPYVNIYGMT